MIENAKISVCFYVISDVSLTRNLRSDIVPMSDLRFRVEETSELTKMRNTIQKNVILLQKKLKDRQKKTEHFNEVRFQNEEMSDL